MSLQLILEEYKSDNEAIHTFCDELYDSYFQDNFSEIRKLYNRMKSDIHPITDAELEYVLSTFPLELFVVAENLNRLRLDYAVIKLKNREKFEALRKSYTDIANGMQELNKSEKQDWINHQLNQHSVEYELVLTAYDSVITRVENEQSFSRELIMGAKKIWDSRRSSEDSNPVGPVVPELPEYHRKEYVK